MTLADSCATTTGNAWADALVVIAGMAMMCVIVWLVVR